MSDKKFNIWHRLCAVFTLLVSAVTYLLTIEPTASFWDCGEFIASSYKLEVGHPPGNPVFQLFARIFTMFGDNMHAAVLVNALSAICSALTIFFLYLTIVWFAKRLISKVGGSYTAGQAVAILGSGLVGSLVYCFSDTFWFSAVEGEVYAMSSLFTAAVFWLMTIWYDRADEPHSARWIVLIAFLMGLSIGIHLLNLLAIPALVFMFYYRRNGDEQFGFGKVCKIFLVGVFILALILFLIIPWLPKLAAYVDLLFVNVFGLPYNSGAAFFMIAVLGLCFWGIFSTMKKEKPFWNTALLCLTTIIIGFSVFSIDIIRSCAKTPTNEYQPDNAFTLVRYLSREQYGSTPLLYGQYYDAPYELKQTKYWAPLDGKYKKVDGPVDAKYESTGKMLFPRMWSSAGDGRYEDFYATYTGGKGKKIPGSNYRKPTQSANLFYFFDYQLNWMYWRYFAWNFIGRQNEVHSQIPGDLFHGNWESGIGFIDRLHLGDQSDAPAVLAENKAKNHYFFLPLLLGLLGLFFQFGKDHRGCWLTFLMFFMTGIAIVIYLNQPPYQVRERDYAYAGSFYFFSVWAGLAVVALYSWIKALMKGRDSAVAATLISAACLCVPVEMAAQNWDDHDRSNRATAVEMARNYLESVGPNGILITHGDNDTFPLWYAQEVEDVRTDVRICNTSLLGTDWHIDQMKWACNESAPLPLTVPLKQYLYGTNEYIPILDKREEVMPISDVMKVFRHPELKVPLSSGRKVDYIPSRKISVPVNKENVIKYGIVDARFADRIPDEMILSISPDKDYLSKPELFMLDLLSNYQWDRPINVLNQGGDINMGIKEYLVYEGYSYKLVPFKNTIKTLEPGWVDSEELYRKMTEVYKWDALSREDYFADYQNNYTHLGVMSVRTLFLTAAEVFINEGRDDRALEMLDKGLEASRVYPLESIPLGFASNDYMVITYVEDYYRLNQAEKARALAKELGEKLLESSRFYLEFYTYAKDDFELSGSCLYHLADVLEKYGDQELSNALVKTFSDMVDVAAGNVGEN
ncbi:MAG: DUF2723 domain-containing protein [Bacteroidales bacterium]|nr:DUF2723 domain-containing protein [Bacteroidales bacterium]